MLLLSELLTEDKLRRPRSVLGWVTTSKDTEHGSDRPFVGVNFNP